MSIYGTTFQPFPRGLSAQAIAGFGIDHPHDPSDLNRCIQFCELQGISGAEVARRMAGRSTYWDRLVPEWDRLVALLRHEMHTATNGKAPETYREMQRVLADGIRCTGCEGSGRGAECIACKGSGRRSGGQCRARNCYNGADYCCDCRGRGFVKRADS